AEAVDDDPGARVQPVEVVAPPHPPEPLAVAAEEDEPAEVAAVRLEQDRLEALDLAPLLQPRVVLHRLVEHLDRLLLAAAGRDAEADEDRRVSHRCPPFVSSARARALARVPTPARVPSQV